MSAAPICMGAKKADNEQAQLIFNSNGWVGGTVGRVDKEAAGHLEQLIIDAWNGNYKEVKISTHSNGVITAHVAWRRPAAILYIEQTKYKIRNELCGTMTLDMLHMQSAVSEYTDLVSPVKGSEWQAKDGDTVLAEIASIGFLFNSEDDATWDHAGFSTVGRREVVPWVIDNEQKAEGVIKSRGSIRCVDDDSPADFLDHSGPLSLQTCPPQAMATHPYDAIDMLDECDYSLNGCTLFGRTTPQGVCYQIW